MALRDPGKAAFDSLRGWVATNAPQTPNVTGVGQSTEDLLRSPVKPFANPAPNPVTPDMPGYHGDGRYGAPANGGANGTQAKVGPVVEGAPGSAGRVGGAPGGVQNAGVKPSLWGRAKAVGSGSFLNADVGATAGKALRGVQSVANSPLGRAMIPAAMIASAAKTGTTPTEVLGNRMGHTAGESFGKDFAIRELGAMADIGDTLTGGHATKLGNWIAGNGYESNNADGTAPSFRPSAPTPSPVDRANQTAATALRTGVKLTGGDAGRGTVNPTTLPQAQDLGRYLAPSTTGRLPRDLSGLDENRIYKTTDPKTGSTVYSGRNVKEDAPIVGPLGNELRQGGGYGVIPALDTQAASLRGDAGSGQDPSRGRSADIDRLQALASSPVGTPGRKAAMLRMQQEIQNEGSLRVAQTGAEASMFGSRLSNQLGRFNALRQQANTDREFAAGRSDKGLEQSGKMDEQARAAFKDRFNTVDKDGKSVARPELEAAAYEEAMRQSGGQWSQMTPAQRATQLSNAADHIKLIASAREHQNNSWLQKLGVSKPDVPHGRMPSGADLADAQLEEVGFVDGGLGANVERGDYRLKTKNGQVMHFGRSDLTQDQLDYLKKNGVKIGGK